MTQRLICLGEVTTVEAPPPEAIKNTTPPARRVAYYSEEQRARGGASTWVRENGEEVLVTQVGPAPFQSNFPDAVFLGEVVRCVRSDPLPLQRLYTNYDYSQTHWDLRVGFNPRPTRVRYRSF